MRTTLLIGLLLAVPTIGEQGKPADASPLFPPIEPYDSGYLKVSDIHEIYYEQCGNPKGKTVFVLHGGPGGGCSTQMRRYFDPEKFHIVLHDQRGAGRSRPYAETRDNDTWKLVEDIETLRRKFAPGKMIVFGGSWGSTLGLAYAEKYPENVSALVLRGLWLCTKDELEHWYGGGVAQHFPEEYAKLISVLPKGETGTVPERLYELLTGPDESLRQKAALAWARYEVKLCYLEKTEAQLDAVFEKWNPYDFALLENYYMINNCFLRENQLIEDVGRLKDIPITIVNGRYDVICRPIVAYRFCQAAPHAKLVITERCGHSMKEAGNTRALVEAMKALE